MANIIRTITIVIPTFKNTAGLLVLLDSIEKQNIEAKIIDIIIIDDQSGEDVDSVIEPWSGRLNIKCLKSAVKGRPGARNTGATVSKSDVLIFIDDDMVLLPDYIEEFMKANHNNPYAVLVSNIETPTDNYSLWNNLHDLRFEQQQKQAETNPYDLPYTCLFTGSLLVPRLLFEKIGGFDQVSFSYYGGEDFDFGIRFRDAGVKIAYANRAIAVHKQKSISFARYLDKTVWEAKSLARLLAKHKGVLAKESHKWEYLGKMPGVDVRLSQPVKQVVKNIIALPVISIMIVLLAGLLWALGLKHMALKVGGFGIKYYGLGYFDKELRTQLIRSKRTA